MMAYIGREGYLINCELRKGSQHCQKHTPEFLRETIAACRRVTKEPLLFRLDSGNDSTDNIGIFLESGCSFITKRNLRRESKEGWLQEVKNKCLDITSPREGKTVYIGSTWRDISYTGSDGEKHPFTVRTVYEITERSIDKHGQYLFPTDVEVNMWDVNVEFSDYDIIALYHAHGESEQFHSEIKTDMDLERFPSGKFDTNELVLELAMSAYNILRMIGDESIDPGHPMRHPVKKAAYRHGHQEPGDDGMPCHQTCPEVQDRAWREQCMAEDFPESVSVVQLSITITIHNSAYIYNITKQVCSDQLLCRWSGIVYAFLWKSNVYDICRKGTSQNSRCFSEKYWQSLLILIKCAVVNVPRQSVSRIQVLHHYYNGFM